MRVSILIPTLNRKVLLARALDSSRRQTKPAHEILISDDGSTDGTQQYVASIAAVDSRVRLLAPNPCPGIFTNFNYLISQSDGDAFCVLGDDDRLAPEYLERLCEPLISDPEIVASFCDHGIVDTDGRVAVEATAYNSRGWGRTSLSGGVVSDPLAVALKQSMCIGFAIFRSSVFKGLPFDVRCGGAADVDYTIRAASLGKLYYVPLALGDYGQHSGTATRNRAVYMVEGLIRALKKHSFTGGHEQARLGALRKALLSHAVLISPSDGRASLDSLSQFIRLGGSPVNGRVVLAVLLAISPRPLAQRLESFLRANRRRLARIGRVTL